MADESRQTDSEAARQAAIQSLVSNLVYVAVMVGVSLAITKRDAIGRLIMRYRAWGKPRPVEYGEALHELRRDIARFEGRQP